MTSELGLGCVKTFVLDGLFFWFLAEVDGLVHRRYVGQKRFHGLGIAVRGVFERI
jgi:hypothetical protein